MSRRTHQYRHACQLLVWGPQSAQTLVCWRRSWRTLTTTVDHDYCYDCCCRSCCCCCHHHQRRLPASSSVPPRAVCVGTPLLQHRSRNHLHCPSCGSCAGCQAQCRCVDCCCCRHWWGVPSVVVSSTHCPERASCSQTCCYCCWRLDGWCSCRQSWRLRLPTTLLKHVASAVVGALVEVVVHLPHGSCSATFGRGRGALWGRSQCHTPPEWLETRTPLLRSCLGGTCTHTHIHTRVWCEQGVVVSLWPPCCASGRLASTHLRISFLYAFLAAASATSEATPSTA